jgi:hypothetical protein
LRKKKTRDELAGDGVQNVSIFHVRDFVGEDTRNFFGAFGLIEKGRIEEHLAAEESERIHFGAFNDVKMNFKIAVAR